jgi:hypothetical protein
MKLGPVAYKQLLWVLAQVAAVAEGVAVAELGAADEPVAVVAADEPVAVGKLAVSRLQER